MKKELLLLLLIFFSMHVFAQEETSKKSKIEVGLQHSFNFTYLVGTTQPNVILGREDKVETRSPRFTVDAGFFVNAFLSNKISLQAELLYTYMGSHMKEKTSVYQDLYKAEEENYFTYTFNYVKLPLVFNIYPHERFFIQAGGYGAALISATRYYPYTFKSRDVVNNPSPIDAGLIFGAGVDLKVVNLTFRYNYGLVDIFKSDENQTYHNGVLQLNANWKIYRSH